METDDCAVNRLETCPSLIRVFYQKSAHHTIADFVKSFPSPEIYLYTWADATLKELAYTIAKSIAGSNETIQKLSVKMLEPDLNEGGWIVRALGVVDFVENETSQTQTLQQMGWKPGFLFDVAYTATA